MTKKDQHAPAPSDKPVGEQNTGAGTGGPASNSGDTPPATGTTGSGLPPASPPSDAPPPSADKLDAPVAPVPPVADAQSQTGSNVVDAGNTGADVAAGAPLGDKPPVVGYAPVEQQRHVHVEDEVKAKSRGHEILDELKVELGKLGFTPASFTFELLDELRGHVISAE